MIRAALTALADRIMRPREVCPICRCRVYSIAVCVELNHAGDPTPGGAA